MNTSNLLKWMLVVLCWMLELPNAICQHISLEQSYRMAQDFIQSNKFQTRNDCRTEVKFLWDSRSILSAHETRRDETDFPTFYAYLFENEGFIILSADSCYYPIVGYSFTSTLPEDVDDLPAPLRDYLLETHWQVKRLSKSSVRICGSKAGSVDIGGAVVELHTATWGQANPYNQLCFTSKGRKAVTGCVPTAYAILMRHHQWPVCAQERAVYHSGTGEKLMLGHSYNWDDMLISYRRGYSEEQANAVAVLMRDLGYAYQVDYGINSTQSGGGGEGAGKLIDLFKYKSDSPDVSSSTYGTVRDVLGNDALWMEYIKQSLHEDCPIPYSSMGDGGRHIFILDGYTEDDYFHFNWGWNGQGNGFFRLNEMKPDASSDYSHSHRAYFNLRPNREDLRVRVAVNNPNAGCATVNGESYAYVQKEETFVLHAVPFDGYEFVGWMLDGENISSEEVLVETTNADRAYTACFVATENTGVQTLLDDANCQYTKMYDLTGRKASKVSQPGYYIVAGKLKRIER